MSGEVPRMERLTGQLVELFGQPILADLDELDLVLGAIVQWFGWQLEDVESIGDYDDVEASRFTFRRQR